MDKRERVNKISVREKVAFGMANMGNIPIMALVGTYLLIFYTDIVGLNPAAVATLFIFSRILDGINDPIMGFVIDHLPKSRMGRFRPYLIIGVILCAVNYLMLWFAPLLFPGIKLVVVYITYLLIGISFDMMDIPLNAMIPVMTDDEKERGSLSAIKGASYMVGILGIGMAAPLIIRKFGNSVTGYLVLVGGATAIVLLFSIIGALGIKERVQPTNEEKYKFRDLFSILRERPVVISFVVSLLGGVAMTTASSSNIYFATYILDNRMDVLSFSSLISMGGMFAGMFLTSRLIGRLGKKTLYGGSIVLFGIFMLIRLFSVTSIPLIYLTSLLGGVGSGGMMALSYGIQADNVDYIDFKRGTRAEGALASLNSFVIKAGQGFGGAIPGYVLAATGYAANQAQIGSAITGIIGITILIPGLINIVSGIIFIAGYNLDKNKMSEITDTLRARRKSMEKEKKNRETVSGNPAFEQASI